MRMLRVVLCLLLVAPAVVFAQEPPQNRQAPPTEEQPKQGPKVLIAVHGISQRATSTSTGTVRFPQYDEEGTTEFTQKFGGASGFGFEAGYRVWRNAYAGVGYTRSATSGTGSVSLSVPHPVFFGQARTATEAINGAKQKVQAVNLWAGWQFPISGPMDVILSAGPSFVTVRRDVAVEETFTEGPAPYTSIVAGSPRVESRSKTVTGVQVAATFNYRITRILGASGTLRYLGATADIQGPAGVARASAGGLSIGAGVQFVF